MKLGTFMLKKISLSVPDGESLALVGPNGSGKTTLLECIAGIRQIESGKIEFNGTDVTDLASEKRQVGYVPQDCLLFPHLTVEENIAFGQREPEPEATRHVREMMAWLGISHLIGHNTTSLSGGEKQKVALARALMTRPRVLLLDEPFSAVDRSSRTRLLGELRKSLDEVSRSLSLALIYVTHDLAEAQVMSEHVAIMNRGRIEQTGTWNEILQTPRSSFVADFMGFNILRGHVTSTNEDGAVVDVDGQSVEGQAADLTVGQDVLAVVRPEAVSLSLERDIRRQSWRHCQCNVFKGSVMTIRRIGPLAQVSVDVGFPLNSEISSELVDELNLATGCVVFAQFRASEVSFLRA